MKLFKERFIMKKILNLLMIVVLVFSTIISFTGCEEKEPELEIVLTNPDTGEVMEQDGYPGFLDIRLKYNGKSKFFNPRIRDNKTNKFFSGSVQHYISVCVTKYIDQKPYFMDEGFYPVEKGEYSIDYSYEYFFGEKVYLYQLNLSLFIE
jgi:hypothetical protein